MPALSFAVKYQRMQIPSRGHIEHQHRERQLSIFIIAVVEHEPEARFVFVTGALPFEVRVLSYHIGNVRKYRRQVFVTVENDDGGFGVSPRRIAEQLVNLCFEVYWVMPDQALPDENVPPTDLDDDVGLAFPVEGFSCGPAFVIDVQRHQQHEAQGFFIHFGKRFRIKFHDPRHAANRLQDVVEDSFNQQRVSRMWSPRWRGACHAHVLSLIRNSTKLRGVHQWTKQLIKASKRLQAESRQHIADLKRLSREIRKSLKKSKTQIRTLLSVFHSDFIRLPGSHLRGQETKRYLVR
jgi:hypothetical protein